MIVVMFHDVTVAPLSQISYLLGIKFQFGILILVWDKNPSMGQESLSGTRILVWDINLGLGQESGLGH